ncbi:NAD(P)H-quinone oxidoreductase subunit T, chloroplastic [Linum perenne]
MASTAAPYPQASYPTPLRARNSVLHTRTAIHGTTTTTTGRSIATRRNGYTSVVATASKEPERRQRAPPGVDTRIHWDNEDEGWIGGDTSTSSEDKDNQDIPLGETFADLLKDASDSHYQFLGVQPEADLEEIKAAFRKLSKEYHPDTTSLPLKAALEKFMRLRQIYAVLSDGEKRKFYDWTLAQEAASRQAEKMRIKLEDPKEQDFINYESVPDMVDRLGGRNLELSEQAMSALTFDAIVICFAICCIIYVVVFREPYYY